MRSLGHAFRLVKSLRREADPRVARIESEVCHETDSDGVSFSAGPRHQPCRVGSRISAGIMPFEYGPCLPPEKEKLTLPTVSLTTRLDRRRHQDAARIRTATDIDWLAEASNHLLKS